MLFVNHLSFFLLDTIYIDYSIAFKQQFAYGNKLISLLLRRFDESGQILFYLIAIVVAKYDAARMKLWQHSDRRKSKDTSCRMPS